MLRKQSCFLTVYFSLFLILGLSSDLRAEKQYSERQEFTESTIDGSELIYTTRLRIPSGFSSYTGFLPVPTGSSPLTFTYVREGSCPVAPGMHAQVRIAATGLWESTQHSNFYDYYSGGPISAIRFDFLNQSPRNFICTWRIFANEGVVVPLPSNESLLGAINYTGGFQAALEITLDPTVVTHLRLAVPQFCKGLEILEASTVTEGVLDKATLLNAVTQTYSVNSGTGSRISKIRIVANGPTGLSCEIPVFITSKP